MICACCKGATEDGSGGGTAVAGDDELLGAFVVDDVEAEAGVVVVVVVEVELVGEGGVGHVMSMPILV